MITGKARRGRGWVCGGLVVLAVFLALAFSPVGAVRAAVTVPGCMGSSLATAINNANAGDTINFALDCPGTTAANTLTSVLTINKNLTIDGTGHMAVVISGGNAVRLFTVSSGVTFTVNTLTLTGGNANNGGGILNNGGTLTVTNSTLSGNTASGGGGGGGIFSDSGTVTVEAIGAARKGTGKPLAVILVTLARTPGRLRTEDDKTGFMPSLIGHCPRQGHVSVRPRWIEPLARPTTAFC